MRISLLEQKSATGNTLIETRSHEQSMEHKTPRLRLVADVINHYEELIQN